MAPHIESNSVDASAVKNAEDAESGALLATVAHLGLVKRA